MKKLSILVLILFSIFCFALNDKSDIKRADSTETIKILPIKIDPITVQSEDSDKKPNHWPWIAALIVGTLTFSATIIAAIINRKTTIKSILVNKEIAIEQINNSKLSTLNQFSSTLKSRNRQDWIDNVRNTISSLNSDAIKLNVELQDAGEDNLKSIKELHGKIAYSNVQLELLLNPNNESHKKMLNEIRTFINLIDEHILNYRAGVSNYNNDLFLESFYKVVDQGREILYLEWQKIQKLIDEN